MCRESRLLSVTMKLSLRNSAKTGRKASIYPVVPIVFLRCTRGLLALEAIIIRHVDNCRRLEPLGLGVHFSRKAEDSTPLRRQYCPSLLAFLGYLWLLKT